MQSGFLVINKERDMGSTKVVSVLKHILHPKKIGHAGTLDPLAEGVLVIAINEATKLIRFVEDGIKEYIFDIKWGTETSTDDMEGEVTEISHVRPTQKEIEAILPFFTGAIKQFPPKYSAIKIDGQRAYDLARKNVDFDMKERGVMIENIEIISHDTVKTRLKVVCHKGTYVRSLARDIARKLNSRGHVSFLQRTRVGKFLLSDAILLPNSENIEHNLESFIKPLSTMLDDILAFAVSGSEASSLQSGKKVRFCTSEKYEDILISCDGKLVAIADIDNGIIIPKRIIFDN